MMIYFAIPLRAKATSSDWDNVCNRLEVTLKSIASSGDDYHVYIAGHDKPDFIESYEKVTFLRVSLSVPVDKNGYMADKESKKNAARRKIVKLAKAGDLFMFLDADDVLSNNFQSEINDRFSRNQDIDDIAFYTGFVYDVARKKIAYLNGKDKVFYRNCGSCFISRITNEDLDEPDEQKTFIYSLRNHTKYPEFSLCFGRSVLALKVPVACYIVNHGSNDAAERVGSDVINKFVDQFECKDEKLIEKFNSGFVDIQMDPVNNSV